MLPKQIFLKRQKQQAANGKRIVLKNTTLKDCITKLRRTLIFLSPKKLDWGN
jgi:hypothetical protein